eukprot:GHVU01116622.1.p1 GENE.GHVU01116622.1~~GHVU01116622.1.p1  ORF type:complete len:291 (-),score=33.77 GHVU01116622.1:701-1573(-)
MAKACQIIVLLAVLVAGGEAVREAAAAQMQPKLGDLLYLSSPDKLIQETMTLAQLKQIFRRVDNHKFSLKQKKELEDAKELEVLVQSCQTTPSLKELKPEDDDEGKVVTAEDMEAGRKLLNSVSSEFRQSLLVFQLFGRTNAQGNIIKAFSIKRSFFGVFSGFSKMVLKFDNEGQARAKTWEFLDVLTTPDVVKAYGERAYISTWMTLKDLKALYKKAIAFVRKNTSSMNKPTNWTWKAAAAELQDPVKLRELIFKSSPVSLGEPVTLMRRNNRTSTMRHIESTVEEMTH